jgi:hypothetical protein
MSKSKIWLAVSAFAAVVVLTASAVAFAKRGDAPRANEHGAVLMSIPASASAVSTPAFGTFLGPCNTTADCEEGTTCQSYKQYGLRCTKSCETGADCPAPSKGCSKQHRCSMPTATNGNPRK